MIGLLFGRVVSSEPDGVLIIDVNGVGYEVTTPLGTTGRASTDEDGRTTLYVQTYAREDTLQLFGFASALEKQAFLTLLQLPKVGPKLALAVLGTFSVAELAQAVERGDPRPITRVPGVGKRTAERMLVELKGKLTGLALGAAFAPGSATAPRPAATPLHVDPQAAVLHGALVRMGFKPSEVDRAVAQVEELDRPMAELIREALAILAP